MRWKWTSGRKKAHVEFPCVWFIWIIKEEIFLFLLFLGFCFIFPSFPPPLTRGLWALGTASGKTDLKATTPCRSFHFLEEQLRLWVCEDTLAITLPPHIIICEIFSLSVSETSLTWSVVWSLSSTALFEEGSWYNGLHLCLSSTRWADLSPFS